MRVLGYARVSSKDQDLTIQIREIQKYCEYRGIELVRIFTDKATGKNTDREGFQDMMQAVHKNTFGADGIVITKIDRIGRNLFDLMKILDDLNKNQIQFVSITDNIDTTSPLGKLMFGFMGAFAEYERTLIRERCQKGIDEAVKTGTRFGRPRKHIDMELVKADIAAGIPKTKICKKYKISKTYLYSRIIADTSENPSTIPTDSGQETRT